VDPPAFPQIFHLKLFHISSNMILLFLLISGAASAPQPAGGDMLIGLSLDELSVSDLLNPLGLFIADDDMIKLRSYYEQYVPQQIKSFVNETMSRGRDVAYNVYDDIQEQVVKQLEGNVDEVTALVQNFMDKLEGIYNDTMSIAAQTEPLSEKEIEENNAGIQKMREKLKSLSEKVKQEMAQQEAMEGLEKTIQTFLTFSRSTLSETVSQFDLFWSKNRQNEVLEFKNFEAFADATEDLQNIVTKLFNNLQKIDVSKIGEEDSPRASR